VIVATTTAEPRSANVPGISPRNIQTQTGLRMISSEAMSVQASVGQCLTAML